MPKVVLAVDDSASARQMVRFTLEEAGYEVREARDGVDAMGRLEAPLHLVVTDLNMPNMDGIELIRQIRGRTDCRGVPILMLTTESQDVKKQEGRAAGATGWIVKPFQPEKLVAVVKKLIG